MAGLPVRLITSKGRVMK